MCTKVLKWFPTRLLLFGGLFLLLMGNLTFNVSDSSSPVGLYRVQPVAKLKLGELALLRMPMKEVYALPGDHVRFTPQGVYREGELIPNSAPEPGLARVCPFGDYTVPPDMFLGMGTHNPDSWDGRYTCFLPLSLIAGKATPIWTR
jgi:type IV secretory pathway protease TraF